MNTASPGESRAMPSQSSRCAGWGVSGSSLMNARMKATIPIGTLMKKIQRQDALSTSHPPRIGPRIGAISIGTPRTPMTRPMRFGPAFLVMIVMTDGMIIPPPMPWSTRKKMREPALQARPDRIEPMVNRTSEVM